MTGDGICAAFADPLDALLATVVLQRSLDALGGEGLISLRVRAGLHLGLVERRDDDLFGSPVNRAARIMKAAHGGQILLSQAVVDHTRERLPSAVSLRDLGAVRLRDLATSEHVYQLVHPELRQDFPALRSLEATPNNLPQQATSFIGRETELAEAKRLLDGTRLLTLLGMGGLGKTRLSLQIAADVLDQYPDGVWFVDLAPIRDPSLVPNATGHALGIREESGKPITQSLCEHLREHKLLIVLDNCEHLIYACAGLADGLLKRIPELKILATSREALHIQGEQTYPVLPLRVPDRKAGADALLRSDAVQLFVERARLQKPDFTVTDDDAPAVAELCARLDGIPLALELAAARLRLLSVGEINARLHDRFKLLTGGSRVALERQQTLRALVNWSYDLLRRKRADRPRSPLRLRRRLRPRSGRGGLRRGPARARRRPRSRELARRQIADHGRAGGPRVALRAARDDQGVRARAPGQALRPREDDPRVRERAAARARRRGRHRRAPLRVLLRRWPRLRAPHARGLRARRIGRGVSKSSSTTCAPRSRWRSPAASIR